MGYYVKRLVVFLIVFSMVLTLAACKGSSEETTTTATTKTDVATTAAETKASEGSLDKTLEISWLGQTNTTAKDGNLVQKAIEEKFNVKIVHPSFTSAQPDKVNLMMASGDIPDGMYGFVNKVLVEENLVRTIPKEMIEKYVPGLVEMYKKYPMAWVMGSKDGDLEEQYFLLGVREGTVGDVFPSTYRLDWMEKLGISPKGTIEKLNDTQEVYIQKEAFTLDEMQNILLAFATKDPDGNNKNDTYGVSCEKEYFMVEEAFGGLVGMFSTPTALNYKWIDVEVNGKLLPNVISQGYKEMLTLLNQWYKMGILDKEFITQNIEIKRKKVTGGSVGYFASNWLWEYALKETPDMKLLITPPEIGPSGKQGKASYIILPVGGFRFYVSKDVDDEKLIRMLQMYQYINFDKEGAILSRYGIAGQHFDWEGEPYNSGIKKYEKYAEADQPEIGLNAYTNYSDTGVVLRAAMPDYKAKLDGLNMYGDWSKLVYYPFKYNIFGIETPELKAFNDANKATNLRTSVLEFSFKAISGEIDINKEWDGYVSNFLKNGGQEYIDIAEKWPKVSDILIGNVEYKE